MKSADLFELVMYQVHCPECDTPLSLQPIDFRNGIAKCFRCREQFIVNVPDNKYLYQVIDFKDSLNSETP